MTRKIGIWQMKGKERSRQIARALLAGCRASAIHAVLRDDNKFTAPREPVAAFYGFQGRLPTVMADYVASGRRVIFVDLGYWHRRLSGRFDGYHKIAIDARDPTLYLMDKDRPHDRMKLFQVNAARWRPEGRHILVAGMSGKSAESHGFAPEEWERQTIAELRRHTDRTILYRPKPSWLGARPIPGSTMAPRQPLDVAMLNCHAVVTHHSNVAIDSLIAGIPAFCWEGAASIMSSHDLSKIEAPWRPDGRSQWLANLAYCQWSTAEMRSGQLWRFLIEEGVI